MVMLLWGTYATQAHNILPYSMGFERPSTSQLPADWLQPSQGSNAADTFPAAYVGSSNAFNGSAYFEFEPDYLEGGSGFVPHTAYDDLTDCTAPFALTTDSIWGDTVWVSWSDTAGNTSFVLAYGPTGFNPDTAVVNIVTGITNTAYMLTNLTMFTNYDIYVRADCGVDDSLWIGPVSALPGYFYSMPVTGSDTLHVCDYTIYDNGGAAGNYSSNCNSTLVLYPEDSSYTFILSGTVNIDWSFDHLYIYDGVGVNGTLLYQCNGSATFSNIRSDLGVVTINFQSDNLMQYSGFAISAMCVPRPNCMSPSNLATTFIGTTTATLTWTEHGTATSWVVRYDTMDFNPSTDTAANTLSVSDTTVSLIGLDSNALYHVYVAADCGNESSFYIGTTFSTLATSPASLPFSCDFEGSSASGWNFVNGTQTNKWHVGNAISFSGIRSLYISNTGGTTHNYNGNDESIVYATRTIDLTDTGRYEYSFIWKCNGDSLFDYMRAALVPVNTVFVAGSPSGFDGDSSVPTGGIALDSAIRLRGQINWQTHRGEFHLATPGTYKIVFAWINNNLNTHQPPAAIDDITIALNNCPTVDNLATYLTQDTIAVRWSPTGRESQWMVCCDTMCITTYDTSYVFAGLTPNKTYTISVQPLCIHDTGTAVTTTVRTNCSYIDTLPYSQDFESVVSSSDNFVDCWHRISIGTNAYQPYVSRYNHTPGGHKGLYWANYYSSNDQYYLILPSVNPSLHPLNTLQLTFWANKTFNYGNASRFIIGAIDSPTDPSTFQPVDTVFIPFGGWTIVEVPFTNYTGTATHMAIMAADSTNVTYLDDFSIEEFVTCVRPINPVSITNTANSVTLTWDERGTANKWQIAVETSATSTPTADTTVLSDTATVNVPSGIRYFYVRSICGEGDTSLWSDGCIVHVGGWAMRPNQTDTLHLCGGIITDDGGITDRYSDNQDSYVILLPDEPNSVISVSGTSYTESRFDYLRIYDGIGNGGTELWNDSNNYYANQTFGPLVSTSGPITIYFHSDGTIQYDGFTIYVSCIIDSCRQPVITGVSKTFESATVNWVLESPNYEVNIKEYESPYWLDTNISVIGNSYTFTGLQPSTPYVYRVRQDCNADGLNQSEWTIGYYITDDLNCHAPDSITVTNATSTAATLDWTPVSQETAWNIRVWNSNGTNRVYTVSTHPSTIIGLTANTTYKASIRALCGTAHNYIGDWGDTVTFTTTVGIDGVVKPTCIIYPNPTSGSTTVTVSGVNGKVTIAVIDLRGREVATSTLNCSGDCAKTMDVERLAQGAYFVRITAEKVSMVRKLIVK